MSYNGFDLSKILIVTKGFTSFGGANYELDTKDSVSNGVLFYKKKFKEKIIKVPFFVNYPTVKDYDYLQSVFSVNEPKQLIFSHHPDRYFLAIPTGDLNFEEFKMNGRGTITFLIPDGIAHSVTYKQVLNYKESGNKLIFDIENNGNTDALPIIRIENVEELGYAGVVNQTGVIEIGNINEQGTETFKRSEWLVAYDSSGAGFEVNKGIFNDDAWALTGNIGTVTRDGRKLTYMSGINSTNGQNGASMTFTIPADSNGEVGSLYDYIFWRQAFEASPDRMGIFKLAVTDINDQFMYGIQAVKYAKGWLGYYDILGRSEEGTTTVHKREKISQTSNNKIDNPLCFQKGMEDLKRIDDKITYFWNGAYKDIYMPEIKGMLSHKIHILFGNFGANQVPEMNYLQNFKYSKDFVVKDRDIPNRYPAGSKIIINNEDNTLQVDGKPQLNDVVQGSTFITIPPGKSTLEVSVSDWVVKKPKVTIEFEERWL